MIVVRERQHAAFWGAPGRIRTCDARFRKPTLYPLSYGSSGSPVYKGPPPMAGEVPTADVATGITPLIADETGRSVGTRYLGAWC